RSAGNGCGKYSAQPDEPAWDIPWHLWSACIFPLAGQLLCILASLSRGPKMEAPSRLDSGGRDHHYCGSCPTLRCDKTTSSTQRFHSLEWSDPTCGHRPLLDLDIHLRIS